MNESPDPSQSLVISYLNLRRAVGLVGMALPFALMFGKVIQGVPGLLDSISGYYYSGMRDVFVGGLWAIGIFLWSYRGYKTSDNVAGGLACFAAIGVSLFPTTLGLTATPKETTIGYIHLGCAACFFAIMAYFCLKLFTKSSKAKSEQTPQKRKRNNVYIAAGWIIIVCIVLIAVLTFIPTTSPVRALNPVLWLETIAIEAFGASWFVKGEAILKDP